VVPAPSLRRIAGQRSVGGAALPLAGGASCVPILCPFTSCARSPGVDLHRPGPVCWTVPAATGLRHPAACTPCKPTT